ncbi:MAG: NHL domain-containing protein [Planctomycetota bacterium]|jgi:sugar lactone lactonase YvrE
MRGRIATALGLAAVLGVLPGCGLSLTIGGVVWSTTDDDDDDPNRAPTGSIDSPTGLVNDVIRIDYRVVDAESNPVNVQVHYSTDGGATFSTSPATAATGLLDHDGTTGLATSPSGVTHTFLWNSAADLPVSGKLDNVADVVVRVRVTQTDGLAGPVLQTTPFTSWNRYTATVAGGQSLAVDGAITNPSGSARTTSGDLIIADAAGHKVVRLDAVTGAITTIAGTGEEGYNGDNIPATDAKLNAPADVAIDANGHIYIADRGNSRIRQVHASTGFITTVAGNGAWGYKLADENGNPLAASLTGPEGIDVDVNGNLWIADTGANRIRMVNRTASTVNLTYWNGTATVGVAINPNAIRTVAGGWIGLGEDINPLGAAVSAPRRVRLIEINNVLDGFVIAETGLNRVRVVSLRTPVDGSSSTFFGTTIVNGQIRTVAGTLLYLGFPGTVGDGGAATSGKLSSPTGIDLLWDLLLFVADTGHNRVRIVSNGVINTMAGSGGFGDAGDGGLPQLAQLAAPLDVAMDESLNMFISDTFNGRIRMTNTSAWSGLWAAGANDVWLTGGGGLATHTDGTTFTRNPVGTPELLLDVSGTGTTDIVTCGISGGIYRWDGTQWTPESSGTTLPLLGVDALSTTAQWCVGGFGTVLFYNGSTWTPQTSGVPNTMLLDVWAATTSNVWAVGETGTVRYFNGSTWAAESGIPSTTLDLEGVHGRSTTDIYVVGGGGTFWHKSGSGWTDHTSGSFPNKLLAVWSPGANDAFAVGEQGTILRWNGASLSAMTSPVTDDLQAVWGTSATNVYAVGFGDKVIHWNGTAWTPLAPNSFITYAGVDVPALTIASITQPPAQQVLGVSDPQGLVVDGNGDLYFSDAGTHRVMHLDSATRTVRVVAGTGRAGFAGDGGSAAVSTALTGADFRGVWGPGASDVWAAGGGGVLAHYNGTAWSLVQGPAAATLNAVHGSSGSDGWAVGDGGVILHYNGTAWSAVTSGTTADLNAVYALSSTDAFIAGDGGVILRWNGSQWSNQTAAMSVPPTTDFHGIWAASGTDAWVVGQGTANPTQSPIWHWNGTAWSTTTPPISPLIGLNAITGFGANAVWAVGDVGVVYTYNGTWSAQLSAVTTPLRAVFGRSASDLFAAGDTGGFQARNTNWTTNTGNNDTIVESIGLRAGVAFSTRAFVVGDDGTIYEQSSAGSAWALQHGLAQLNGPRALALSPSGQVLYIADTDNQRIRAVNLGTTNATLFAGGTPIVMAPGTVATVASGSPIVWPTGVTVDPQTGDLYIADLVAHQIHKVDASTGAVTTAAGTTTPGLTNGAAGSAQFRNPLSCTFDRINSTSWQLYIADTGNHAVRLLTSAGTVSTVAGTGTAGFDSDGKPPTSTLFNSPYAVAVVGNDFYVADAGNARIRKVTGGGSPVVSTVVGTGASGFGGDPKPPANAQVNIPSGMAWDPAIAGLYFADSGNGRVRRFRP